MTDVPERELERTMMKSRANGAVDRIEFLRCLRQLHEQKMWTQTRLAKANGVTQPAISKWLKMARIDAPDLRPGTAGGTPYEIAARYAAGLLDRETMIEQLSEWVRHAATQTASSEDDVSPLNSSGFNLQVGRAMADRFIDETDFDRILDAIAD
ncbi:helix-turn-helix transcriptional regulator [Rhodococcus ruber]|uniref:Helix-turn-helix transcriptional regulator n=1 Tax=Rhodococcus ruber TaxID=1830 RepID=A0ABT4MDL4_9NOCA|nr:helix-turn-helix transcriptional regulator [Rhodococcus ruber]MCZ4518928.1 helix-turn-helix transcriptional regulator [Rhodococcus ruber]